MPLINNPDPPLRIWARSSAQQDPVVELHWQVNEETIALLAERKVEHAQLFIVTASGSKEGSRLLVPLEAKQWYVPLHYPGVNTIHATIVWGEKDKDNELKRMLLKRSASSYVREALREYPRSEEQDISRRLENLDTVLKDEYLDADEMAEIHAEQQQLQAQLDDLLQQPYLVKIDPGLFDYSYASVRGLRQTGSDQLDVEVPAAMFGDSLRLTKWLGTLIMKEPRDQCQIRRWAIGTVAVTILTAPFWAPVLLGLVICYSLFGLASFTILNLLGMRNVNYEYLKGTGTPWHGRQPSRWWTKQSVVNGQVSYAPRHPVFYILNPPLLLGAIGLYLFIRSGATHNDTVRLTLWGTLFCSILVLIAFGIAYYFTRWDSQRTTPEAIHLRIQTKYSPATGPSGKPLIQLHYLKLKSKVCKPFQRQ